MRKQAVEEEKEMPFIEHLDVLRKHILRSFLGIFIGMIIVGIFFEHLVTHVIMGPTKASFITYTTFNTLAKKMGMAPFFEKDLDIELMNLTPGGQITSYFVSIFVGGFIIAVPFVIYQMWLFLKPALTAEEKKYSFLFMISGTFLFVTGILFSYFLILPFSINFLYFFNVFQISNKWNLNDYMSVFNQTLIGMGVVFLLPIITYTLAKMGIVDAPMMKKYRSYAFVIVLIIAAIITPSDVLSMLIAAIPLWALYELSILIVKLTDINKLNHDINKV